MIRTLRELQLSIRSLFRRRQEERQLDEELQFHLERQIEQNLAAGMLSEEARYAALRKFGNVTRVKEETWEVWSFVWLEQLWQDLRFGLRMLVKKPGFTAVAALTLGLGIGVTSTIFGVVSTMLLRQPPVSDPDRLLMLCSRAPGAAGASDYANHMPVSPPDFLDWRAQATAFSGIAASSSFESSQSRYFERRQ